MPKVFISYSRKSFERVLELATRLRGDGVDVILDTWDLKEGQDKHVFMEQSVNDESIHKVLLICDKAYAEKANTREGGVGDETMIISAEVYGRVKQGKFIPIIFERNENGETYTPTYLKSRIYIDLCQDNSQYEKEYEKLLRNLYEKPEHQKPVLGKRPEFLKNENVDFSDIRDLLRQVQTASTQDVDFDKQLRDLFSRTVDTLIKTDSDVGDVIGNAFREFVVRVVAKNVTEIKKQIPKP